jgi:hypothetical protein
MDSEFFADLDFLTGAIVAVVECIYGTDKEGGKASWQVLEAGGAGGQVNEPCGRNIEGSSFVGITELSLEALAERQGHVILIPLHHELT